MGERAFKNLPFRKGRCATQKPVSNPEAETEERFAKLLLVLGSPEEAALRLGISPDEALGEGLRLAARRKVKSYVEKNGGADTCRAEVLAGLRRLAFGRINDALTLLGDDFDGLCTSRLDLYNVSEIKRAKGGGVEIKFFDRLEALKRLAEIGERTSGSDSADSFFAALKDSATGDGD